jgi:hypothetical protein
MAFEPHDGETQNEEVANLQPFRCVKCGHGATSTHAPARCPICNGKAWAIELRAEDTLLQDLYPATRPDSAAAAATDADLPLARDWIFPGVPLS